MKSFKNKLLLKYPASIWGARWKDALPAGNGCIGAAVYGGTHEETVMITHEDLWWQAKTPEMPDVSEKLPKVRRLLLENQSFEADRVLVDAFRESGYSPELGCPLPLGDFKIFMPGKQAFKDYSRSLDMETGEIIVRWLDGQTVFERALFVSRTDDVVVCEIRASGPAKINCSLAIDLHDRSDARMPSPGMVSPIPEGVEMSVDGAFIKYAARNDVGKDFGAVAKVITEGGQIREEIDGLHITEANRVFVCLKPFIKGSREEAWEKTMVELQQLDTSYERLFRPHAEKHREIFGSMCFEIEATGRELSNEQLLLEAYQGEAPAALIEKMWAFGRYLLISSSREGGHPCSLMGLWCGEYSGFWAFNMVNENLQMNYWQALSGNMPELLLAVFDYFDRLMDDFKENAKKIYGCRGIYIPAPTSPDSGLIKSLSPHIIHWTGGAGWVAQHYYDYYLHTGDIAFLKERALPFLREAALFYEDFFTVGEDGYFISAPSNSPENTPGNYWREKSMGREAVEMATTMNATMDYAIAKEVLTHLLEGCALVDAYADEVETWRNMLKRIPPYQINEDGAVKEWMHPFYLDNYNHRHESHIYPIFPGTEVTRENDPDLFEAFVTAVKKRLVIGLKQQSGWSLAHMANVYARMGEGDQALECLDIVSRSCLLNNFYTLHNDYRRMGIGLDFEWAPFQIDANMGWSAAVQEMLLFSVPGSLSILPALPKRWRKGHAGPMLARGGIKVGLNWDQDAGIFEVELLSEKRDQEIRLVLPHIMRLETESESGQKLKSMQVLLHSGVRQSFIFRNE